MGDTIKGIIFDMDGLMLDTEKLLTRFWCEAAAFYGFEMTKQHVLGIRSLAAKYAIPHLREIFGESFDYRAVRAKRIELMNAFIEHNGIEKKKGLDILLESLSKRDIKLAVATATDIARTRMYLEKAGVIGYFDAIVTGDTVLSAFRAGCKPVMIPDLSAPDEETRAMLYGCFDSLGDFGKQLDVLL